MKIKLQILLFLFTLLVSGVFFSTLSAQGALPAPSDENVIIEGGENGHNFLSADADKENTPQNLSDKKNKNTIEQTDKKLPVYFYWGDGCPHCKAEGIFLNGIKDDYAGLEFYSFETWNNKNNYNLLLQVTKEKLGKASGAVPVLIIGDEVVVGFRDNKTTGARIKHLLDRYALGVKGSSNGNNKEINDMRGEWNCEECNKFKLPLIGEFNVQNVSLPALTVMLGLLDGFNPCSMWALVMLITLLINTGSKKKMWIVGGTFILVSALSYFLFLTAWLNTFLLIGYLQWVRMVIGIGAIVIGVYFLRDYWKNRKQSEVVCEVTSSKTKEKIINRLQNTLKKNSIWAMIIGVAVVAFGVNLIELMCSAGIPAIYTQVLSQNELPRIIYYLYLLGYDFFYMLDDIVVLLIAGFTWQMFIGLNKYAKFSHLIGGILVLILGAIMLLNPNLLMG